MDHELCPGKCPHLVVGAAIRTIHGLLVKGREKSARLQLLMTFPELTPEQIDLIVAGRTCRGEAVGDQPGIFCGVR
jgi:hypothetical protein